ncbi:hypothetical protein AC579_8923 [Pseudocercospora musae]|uniref:BTB domain-containing protein n=1 Tax=Pseudocercospora musae TaxID=113226 RepID=A0A139HH37_9PEZI|nr:hypothetical protein AC579_8923 [Pseudocercospora musae]
MATTTPYWQLEKEYYTIADNADVALRIIEHSAITTTENGFPLAVKTPTKLHEFKVHRATLSRASSFFSQLLNRTPETFAEATSDQNVIDVSEDDGAPSVHALALWFKIVHDKPRLDTHELSIEGVWRAVSVAHKYGFSTSSESATNWFTRWYAKLPSLVKAGYKHYTMLLYPAFVFGHRAAFAQATKYLVYHNTGGNIPDHQPREFVIEPPANASTLHTPQHVMHQINAARARLKTILHRALYTPIDRLLKEARCNCAPTVLYNYESSLARTGVWPLESKLMSDSIISAIHDLRAYDGKQWQIQTCGSPACTFDFDKIVVTAREEIGNYFAGLCLDCMTASKGDDAEGKYWSHSKPGVKWDEGCTVNHGQASWYFSFMGPREDMMEWVKAPKAKPLKDRREVHADGNTQTRANIAHHGHGHPQRGGDGHKQAVSRSQEYHEPGQNGTFDQEQMESRQQQCEGQPKFSQTKEYHQSPQSFGRREPGQYYQGRGRGGYHNDGFFAPSRYGKRRGSGRSIMTRDVRHETDAEGSGEHEGESKTKESIPNTAEQPGQCKKPEHTVAEQEPAPIKVPEIEVEVAELKISSDG